MVEGSKFRESHMLKILSWRANKGGMPINSGSIFSFAGFVLVSEREQLPLLPEPRVSKPEQSLSRAAEPEQSLSMAWA